MVHTHGKIKGWGKLLKKKPPPFAKEVLHGYSDTAVEEIVKLRYNIG